MENEKQNSASFPNIGQLFFDVCRTAIKNCAWKYNEFDNIKFVEGQLDSLENFIISARQIKSEAVEVAAPVPTPPAQPDPILEAIEKDIATPIIKAPATTDQPAEDPFTGTQEKKN